MLFTDPTSEQHQTRLTYEQIKVVSRFAAVTNKEISQINKQADPEIHEEGDEIRFGSIKR